MRTHVCAGCQGYVSVVPSCASIANQVCAKFLSKLPHCRSDLRCPAEPLEVCMQRALERLAELAGDDTIAARKPLSSMSFSRVAPHVERLQIEHIRLVSKGHRQAFSPLGADGRPIRRYAAHVGTVRVKCARC
jgi:hypothetical protein